MSSMRFGSILLACLIAIAASQSIIAQSSGSGPTPQQLEMLRSLSAADREALAKQLGIDVPAESGAQGSRRSQSEMLPETLPPGSRLQDERDQIKRLETLRKELALKPADSVVVEVSVKTRDPAVFLSLDTEELEKRLLEDIRKRNPFKLDDNGAIQLPGMPPIALAGLSEQQATARLSAEPAFRNFFFKLSRLPVDKSGFEALKPFGYELFDGAASTFAPVTEIPVPADYLLGPGDELNVQLFGGQNRTIKLVVGRDGRLSFPELGPIPVGGKTFDSVRQDIELRVSAQMLGVRASVSMADTRSIRVFVMGEARQPGSYTVSGLSTVTSALYAAGGVSLTGSLRDIQLKRQGQIVRRFDLYDLLLRGDTSNDAQLVAGDVIFIPPVGATVAIEGEVRRPAIYELRGPTGLKSVLALAGGLTEDANLGRASIVRIDDQQRRIVIDVVTDVNNSKAAEPLRAGDRLRIPRLPPTLDSGVTLEGHFFRPGAVAWREGLRLSAVIPSVSDLKPNADLGYILIRRELPPDRRVVVLSADLGAALRSPGSAADVLLSPRDRLIAFDAAASRRPIVDPLITELRRQSIPGAPSQVVYITGRVKAPGEYPLEPDMRVSDLLRAGGNLQDAAYPDKAELTRYAVIGGERRAELLEFDLAAVLRGDATADVTLQPFDILVVKEVPEWSQRESVVLRGEVRFPGTYPIRRGETLRSVLERAGGLTGLAFIRGAVFSRQDLIERERKQIAELSNRIKADLASRAVQASNLSSVIGGREGDSAGSAVALQALISDLNQVQPVGRLVIDLDNLMAGAIGSSSDVVLRDGDELMIPKVRQEVTVIGEVQSATSHLYRPGLSREDYVLLSGGVTRRADVGRTYVVRANGSVAPLNKGWFGSGNPQGIRPGDTIVVPVNTDRLPRLGLWQAVSTIIYNSAVALAAIRSL